MTRIKKTGIILAALVLGAGWAVSPAAGQLSDPAPGWAPGQPFIVTIQGPRGIPLMVVYTGRIPLKSDPRVRLLLPDLGDSGLDYAVSTRGDPARRRMVPPGFPPDNMMKRGQGVVGRIHTVVISSALNPAIGKGVGTHLSIGAAGLDHWLLPDSSANPGTEACYFGGYSLNDAGSMGTGDDVLSLKPSAPRRSIDGGDMGGRPYTGDPPWGTPPDDDLYGAERRDIPPIAPTDVVPGTGLLPPGHEDGVLSGSGNRATGFDLGGSGPAEVSTSDCTFGGYQPPSAGNLIGKDGVLVLSPTSVRRGFYPSGRPGGRLRNPPGRPDPDPHARRPIRWVPFPTPPISPVGGGAAIGHARFILGVADNGLTISAATG
jgi:hypothetical protein